MRHTVMQDITKFWLPSVYNALDSCDENRVSIINLKKETEAEDCISMSKH